MKEFSIPEMALCSSINFNIKCWSDKHRSTLGKSKLISNSFRFFRSRKNFFRHANFEKNGIE
jgi:hypothetical protein